MIGQSISVHQALRIRPRDDRYGGLPSLGASLLTLKAVGCDTQFGERADILRRDVLQRVRQVRHLTCMPETP